MSSLIIDREGFLANAFQTVKGPCRVATTANITLSGVQVIDGVQLDADDRVLVKDQTNGLNAIYVCKSGDWELSLDFDQRGHVVKGTRVFVTDGATNGSTEWVVTTSGRPVPSREAISFETLSGFVTQAQADAAYQPLDSDLTAIAALATAAFGQALLTLGSEAAFKAALNLEANTDFYAPGGTDVPVVDGGSGRSAATAYAVLCGGTDATTPHQSIAGVGTTGQVLTSNGAGALPTFQAAAVGTHTLIASGAITNAATLDIPLDGNTWDEVEISLIDIVPETDNTSLTLLFDQGAGFLVGASDYQYAFTRGGTLVADTAHSAIVLSDAAGTGTNERVTLKIHLYRPGDADFIKAAHWTGGYRAQNAAALDIHGWGELILNDDAITDARVVMSSDDIASGYYYAIGKKYS